MAEAPPRSQAGLRFAQVSPSDAKQLLDDEIKRGHEGAKDFKQVVEETENNTSSSASPLSTLEGMVPDGMGYEVILSGDAGFGQLGLGTAIGVSALWIIDSDSPDYGGPYYYVYGSVSGGIGIEADWSLGGGAMGFVAWYEGKDATMLDDSWSGVAHQLALQGSLAAGIGAGIGFSYMSSNVPLSGLMSLFSETNQVWRGVGCEIKVTTGAGGDLSVEYGTAYAVQQESFEAAMDYLAGVDDRLERRINRNVNRELRERGLITDEGFWNLSRIEQYFLRGGR
jgi:hypothetical protein